MLLCDNILLSFTKFLCVENSCWYSLFCLSSRDLVCIINCYPKVLTVSQSPRICIDFSQSSTHTLEYVNLVIDGWLSIGRSRVIFQASSSVLKFHLSFQDFEHKILFVSFTMSGSVQHFAKMKDTICHLENKTNRPSSSSFSNRNCN